MSDSVDLEDLLVKYAPGNSVSRQTPDADSSSALSEPFEQRIIVLGQGAFFNTQPDEDAYPPKAISDMSKGAITLTNLEDTLYSYDSDAQQVSYLLYITNEKSVFQKAMQMENVMVIYAGHARHGMGACFHPEDVYATTQQGEWYFDGDGSDNGILRLGFPYVGIPVGDILDNGYTANPLTADNDKPEKDATQLHPKLMNNYSAIKQYAVEDLTSDPDDLAKLQQQLPEGPYWGVLCVGDNGKSEIHLLMISGYTGTTASPFDLDGTTPVCKAFCFFGCSTLVHNYPILRKQYGWLKDGDNKLAYWTDTAAPPTPIMNLWLYYLFSYGQQKDTWEPSCEFARAKTNAALPGMTHFHSKIV